MKQQPNIVWIVCDHQIHATRPGNPECYPLQKKLSELGIEFSRAYSVLPVCSPARASMLTGLYPHAHGLTENDGRFGGRESLDQSDWMIQQSLKAASYRCGWFGKWHLDNHRSAIDYGFEGFSLPGYGYPYNCNKYKDYLKQFKLSPPLVTVEMPGESGMVKGSRIALAEVDNWVDYIAGVYQLDGSAQTHEAFFLTSLAENWINSIYQQPYFVRLDTWGPHPPYILGEPFSDNPVTNGIKLPQNFHSQLNHRPRHHRDYRDYSQETLGLDSTQWELMYQRAIQHIMLIETALHQFLAKIDLENTIVIFNTDHGDAVGSNGGVANKGSLMVEATMKIPLIIAGPGIPRGETRNQLVSQLDLVPTILDLCDVNGTQAFHGLSLSPLINGNLCDWRRGLMTQHYGLDNPVRQRAYYHQEWKLVVQADGFCELYNLEKDAQEMNNLATEPAYGETLLKMQKLLLETMIFYGDDDSCIRATLQNK